MAYRSQPLASPVQAAANDKIVPDFFLSAIFQYAPVKSPAAVSVSIFVKQRFNNSFPPFISPNYNILAAGWDDSMDIKTPLVMVK